MTEKVKEFEVKNIEQDPDQDVELPEIPAWDRIFGRPTSLGDLDPDAEERLDDVDATFLTLGDIAFLDSITETEITNGAITTPKLAAGSVIASKISVGDLAAINADLGTITSGDIRGARIRTSTGGDRVEISDSDDSIRIYDSNDLRMELIENRMTFFDGNEDDVVSFFAGNSGNFLLAGTNGNDLLFSSERDIIFSVADDFSVIATDIITLQAADEITLDTTSLANDIFIGLAGNTFMQFGNGRVYLGTFIDMTGYDITDAGSIDCVSLTETSDIRRKKNIKPLAYGLKEVLQLEPIQYQFKKRENKIQEGRKKKGRAKEKMVDDRAKQGGSHLGFSAQDVYKILPEVTQYADQDGKETARLYSTQMIPVLVRAIQELHKELDLLKSKVLQ